MLKTLKDLFELLRPRKKQLYTSLLLSFVDGFLIVVPILVAFLLVGL